MDLRSKQKKLLIPKLREASRFWSEKTQARRAAIVKLEVGKFKNGKPKYEVRYRCASCRKLVEKQDSHMDHINPVVDPEKGFVDWNVYVDRLLPTKEGYQVLCTLCHGDKTKKENEERRKHRKKKAKKP